MEQFIHERKAPLEDNEMIYVNKNCFNKSSITIAAVKFALARFHLAKKTK